jgi:tetratricopeptide (TPR) repeat protein
VRRPALRKTALVACLVAFAAVGGVIGARQRVAAALAHGDLHGAQTLQDRLAVLRLDDPNQRFTLAHALRAAGQLDAAVAQFEQALARSPQGEQWAALAALHIQRGDAEAAIAAWEHGFETNHDPRYLHRASQLLLQRGEPQRALAEFARASSSEPPSSMTEVRIANMARLMGLPEQQILHLRAAIELEPMRQSLRMQLAWLLATCDDPRQRNPVDAVGLAEALVVETARRDANALDVLAAALASAGRFADAVRVGAEADDLASRENDTQLAAAIRERLVLYRSGRPYVVMNASVNG